MAVHVRKCTVMAIYGPKSKLIEMKVLNIGIIELMKENWIKTTIISFFINLNFLVIVTYLGFFIFFIYN